MKKYLMTIFSAVFLLNLIIGCSYSIGKKDNPAAISDNKDLVPVVLNIQDGNDFYRTALPAIVWSDYVYTMDAVGEKNTISFTEKKPFSAYENQTMYIPADNYTFTLTGYDGDTVVIRGVVNTKVEEKYQSITFLMFPVNDGKTGKAEITVKIPADNLIKTVKAGYAADFSEKINDVCTQILPMYAYDGYKQGVYSIADLAPVTEHFAFFAFYSDSGELITSTKERIIIVGTDKTVSKSTVTITPENYRKAKFQVQYLWELLSEEETKKYTVFKTETKYGYVGTKTDIDPEEIEGYRIAFVEKKTIEKDSSTLIQVKYDRALVKLSFTPSGGYWTDNSSFNSMEIEGKFGQKVQIGTVARDDYVFTGWEPAVPETFPSEAASYTATWNYTGTKYKVEYYIEKDNSEAFTGDEKYELDADKTVEITGKTNETTKAMPLSGFDNGYEVQPIIQKQISADGSTVVKVYYDRKNITYTFTGNGGEWADKSKTKTVAGKYKAAVVTPETTDLLKEDYKFNGWEPTVPAVFGSSDASFDAVWSKEKAPYIIKYLYEAADSESFVENEAERITAKGIIGKVIPVSAASKTGFNEPIYDAAVIQLETETIVEVKYSRKAITLTFKVGDGGKWQDNKTEDIKKVGKFGAAVTDVPVPVKTDWTFIGWNQDGGIVPLTYPAENEEYVAQWSQNPANYTVKHLLQTVDGTSYVEDLSKQQFISGKAGNLSNANALDITGFTAQEITQVTIYDGLVIEVKYDRNIVTMTFNENGGTWVNPSAKTVTGKYGADYSAPTDADLELEDYVLGNPAWSPALPAKIPAENSSYTAQWKKDYSTFVIKYYEEELDGSKKYLTESSAKGKIGSQTAVVAEPRNGFVIEYKQQTILEENTPAVEVLYKRSEYTYTFKLNGSGTDSKWSDSTTEDKIVSGKFGAIVNLPVPERIGYEFAGWNEPNGAGPSTFGEGIETVFSAYWYSRFGGLGDNPANTKITLTESNGSFSVTVPASAATTWTFEWWIDGVKTSYTSQSIKPSLSTGHHTIYVIAKDNKGNEFNAPQITYTKK